MIDARHYAINETLRDGTPILIRALRPDDGPRLAEAFSKLEAESVYTRFFAPKTGLTEEDYRIIREMDFETKVALLVTTEVEGREIVIASSSYTCFAPDAAEVAFIVEEDYHGQGIARKLLHHLGVIARARGITRFEAEVLAQNSAMLRVFSSAGWPMKTRSEDGSIHIVLALDAAA